MTSPSALPPKRFPVLGVVASGAILLAACGGGGGASDGGGGLSAVVLWEQPDGGEGGGSSLTALGQAQGGGFGPQLPASVNTVRFLFQPNSGEGCCVAVDPDAAPRDPSTGQRMLVLRELPPGPGQLTISGYPTDFAPVDDGVVAVCLTDPAGLARSCDPSRDQSPSFASDPTAVNIIAGQQNDAGNILIPARPFIVPGSLVPAPGTTAANPVEVRFTVADAVSGIEESSVTLDLEPGSPALELEPCDDGGGEACSADRGLAVRGFAARRPAQVLSGGAKTARIGARNLAGPPRSLDFTYGFTAQAAPAATNTPIPPVTTTPIPPRTATRTPTRPATRTATTMATRTPAPTRTPTEQGVPTSTATPFRMFSFVPALPVSVAPEPDFLITDDLNEDGLDDLVVVSPSSHQVTVLLGSAESDSGFAAGPVRSFGRSLQMPKMADINGDSHLDVLVADDGEGGVWYLLGDGTGSLAVPFFVDFDAEARDVAVADLDGRNHADLIAPDRDSNVLAIRLNDGAASPRFGAGPRLAVGRRPEAVVTVDFDDDGQLDLASLDNVGDGPKSISVLLFERVTAGLPIFGNAAHFDVGESPEQLRVGDFNNDGRLDLVMLNQSPGFNETGLDVVFNGGDGTLSEPRGLPVPCPFFTGGLACNAFALAVADFDRNDTVDVAVSINDPRADSTTDAVELFNGRGDGVLVAESSFSTTRRPLAIAAGDFNGDGLPDIAVASRRDLNVQTFFNLSNAGE